MKVVFSRRALGNVQRILVDSERLFGAAVATTLEKRFSEAFEQIADTPDGAPRVADRSKTHVLFVTGYPFLIFYRVRGDEIEIAHVRHTARRPWTPEF